MSENSLVKMHSESQQRQASGTFAFLWRRKIWWLLPLAVLVLLLLGIYMLVHLSAADSEMYPTTQAIVLLKLFSC